MENRAEYHIAREYDTGRRVELVLSGAQSLDDVIDAFRGLLVQMGYAPATAARLELRDDDREVVQ